MNNTMPKGLQQVGSIWCPPVQRWLCPGFAALSLGVATLSAMAVLQVRVPSLQPGCGGSVDPGFELAGPALGPCTNFTGSPTPDMISTLIAQPDGKVIVAGGFATIGGVARTGVGRLLVNGQVDPAFAPVLESRAPAGGGSVFVKTAVLQPDGRLVISGSFTHVNGTVVTPGLARLTSNGLADTSFQPTNTPSYVYAMAMDASGRLLVGGSMQPGMEGATPRLVRLDPLGGLEREFEPLELPVPVTSIILQADGKIVVNGCYRFAEDGTFDQQFAPNLDFQARTVALQPDQKILLGGFFRSNPWEDKLIRLNQDGSIDAGFGACFSLQEAPDFIDSTGLAAVAVQADGRILVAGNFGMVDGIHRHFVARLLGDGMIDNSFTPEFASCHACDYGEYVSELALTGDGKLLVAGNISAINGLARQSVARLHLDEGGCAGVVALSSDTYWADESNGAIIVMVTRRGGLSAVVRASYRTWTEEEWWWSPLGIRALPGADYSPITGTVEFGIGESNKTLVIPLVRDGLIESTEWFYFEISGTNFGTVLGAPSRAVIYVADGDSRACPGALEVEFQSLVAPGHWPISCIAAQPDGKLLVSGLFGLTEPPWAATLARFHPDGSLDSTFVPHTDAYVEQVILLPSAQQMLVCGGFNLVSGLPRMGIARVNADGSVDPAFDASLDGPVSAMDRQPDGKIVIYGGFEHVGSLERKGLARLNPDGSPDTSFNTGSGQLFRNYGYLYTLAVQPDGKVVLGGYFSDLLGMPRNDIARLNADGTLDPGFPLYTNYSGAYNYVRKVVLQPDGKILAGGSFYDAFDQPRPGIIRFNADGSVDAEFKPALGYQGSIIALALQPDGKLLLGGDWGLPYPVPHVNFARLHPDGSIDSTFFVGAGAQPGPVTAVALMPDGDIIIGGEFQQVNGFPSAQLARLRGSVDSNNPGAITFGAPQLEVDERSGEAVIAVQRQWGNRGSVSAHFSTRPGTAIVGHDYSPQEARLTWSDGDSAEKFVHFPIVNDAQGNWDRTVWLELSAPSGGTTVGPYATTELTIREDDTTMQLNQSQFCLSETNETVQMVVWCQGRPRGSCSVAYATRDGTARAGVDYVGTSGTIELWDRGSGRTIWIPLLKNPSASGDRKFFVVLSNPSTNVTLGTPAMATITIADAPPQPLGSLDLSFDPGGAGQKLAMAGTMAEEGYGSGVTINALAVQTDGRIVIGGDFVGMNGVPRMSVARLLADGSPDPSFDTSSGADDDVSSVAVQPDGKIVVAGSFTILQGIPRLGLGRLNADGSLDSDFDPQLAVDYHGALVQALVQPDGRILISGPFTKIGGLPSRRLARLLNDGTPDPSFQPDPDVFGADSYVTHMALQDDGRLVAAGSFLSGAALVRFNANGSRDTTFQFGVPGVFGPSVGAVAIQPDGKIMIAYGHDESVVRLNADGSVDPGFTQPGRIVGFIRAIVVQPDGKIVVAGDFGAVGDVPRRSIARFDSDGTLDSTFDPGYATGPGLSSYEWPHLRAMALLPTGHVLVGGQADGQLAYHYGLIRLQPDGSADPQFQPYLHPGNVAASRIGALPDGKILASGDFRVISGQEQHWAARLYPDGSVDSTFQNQALVGIRLVYLADYPDGRTLLGCRFTNGTAGPYGMVRLNPDGTLERAMALLEDSGAIDAAAIDGDGKIVIGGSFRSIDGAPREYIARLNADGSLDTEFIPAHLEVGDDWYITGVGVQSDGRIVVSGHIFDQPWSTYFGIARLNADGSEDNEFRARVRIEGPVFRLLLQPDDKILVNGSFQRANGVSRPGLARLNADGSLDTSFDPAAALFDAPASFAATMALAPDWKLLVATDHSVLRLNPDGTRDDNFHCEVTRGLWNGGLIYSLAVEADGDVLMSGQFRSVNGIPAYGIVRLEGDLEFTAPVVHMPFRQKTIVAGRDLVLQADASGGPALAFQWFLNGELVPGATNSILRLPAVQVQSAGTYTLTASNSAGIVTSEPVLIQVLAVPSGAGSIDLSFDTTAEGTIPGLAGGEPAVFAVAAQPDGKLVVGGSFAAINGIPRYHLARVSPAGHVDPSFDPGMGPDDDVTMLAVQADGKVLLAGSFTHVDGVPRNKVARVHEDGTLDLGFSPQVEGSYSWTITTVCSQPDGRILISGHFDRVSGVSRTGLVRLLPDGSIDESFNAQSPWAGPFPSVHTVRLQPDGKILIGADMQGGIARYHPDGRLDTNFHSPLSNGSALANVYSMAIQVDGKIVVGGLFSYAGTAIRNNMARLYPDGSLDPSFEVNFGSFPGQVFALALQNDGKIVLSGSFTKIEGQSKNHLARVNADGSLDPDYGEDGYSWTTDHALVSLPNNWVVLGVASSGPYGYGPLQYLDEWGNRDPEFRPWFTAVDGPRRRVTVEALAVQPDGRVLAGGLFDAVNDQPITNLARFFSDGTWDSAFVADVGPDFYVRSIALQPEGRMILGGLGSYHDQDGQYREGIARLEPSGIVDLSFHAPPLYRVHVVALQSDGKVLAGGEFPLTPDEVSPEPYVGPSGVIRLNPDGSPDPSFNPVYIPVGGDRGVRAIVVQPDGKIVVGGQWESEAGVSLPVPGPLIRLNHDGTLDSDFAAALPSKTCVGSIQLQPDGKLVVGCYTYYGSTVPAVVRLKPDGTIDPGFQTPLTATEDPRIVTLQPDGRILVGSRTDGGADRLNPDGSLDTTFQTDVLNVYAMSLQADGRIVIGGIFNYVNGVPMAGVARLLGGPTIQVPFVQRDITSTYYRPGGSTYEIMLYAHPTAGVNAYAVEDHPPAGWTVSAINFNGAYDPATGKVKFGPFMDSTWRTLSYEVTPTAGAVSAQCFEGTGSADGFSTPITGPACMWPAMPHPADTVGPGWSMAMDEVTAYGAAWRRGQTWPEDPNPIPINYVTRAAALWREGECYQMDHRATNAPLWWVNCAQPVPVSQDPGTILDQASTVTRAMPISYVPGQPVIISLLAQPGTSASAYAVEDQVPAGWSVSAVSTGGEFDTGTAKVKWGPFVDQMPRSLSYAALAPAGTTGLVRFTGLGSTDGRCYAVSGVDHMTEGCRLQWLRSAHPGQVRLELAGRAGAQFSIEVSTDLVDWAVLGVVTNTGANIELADPAAIESSHRFYRARMIEQP